MEYFWVIFENSQVVLYSLKHSNDDSDDIGDKTKLLDYLLKETRKQLDNSSNNSDTNSIAYTDINDSFEYTIHKEYMSSLSGAIRVTILVTPLQQNNNSPKASDSVTTVIDIKNCYKQFVKYNSLSSKKSKNGKLVENIDKEIVFPYVTMLFAK